MPASSDDKTSSLNLHTARRRMEEVMKANSSRSLFSNTAQPAPEVLPHVYTSANLDQGSIFSQYGTKYALPLGTLTYDYEHYEEVIIPPAKTVPPRAFERSISISELDQLCRQSFPKYTSLNRIQSIVYPTAYCSNENMLVCGRSKNPSGKTDVAMLTILRVLDQNRSVLNPDLPLHSTIARDSFKIIYVAPMKALASEIVRKLGQRLKWLSIVVRELTGDMQMTKAEIAQTQIIVTTPEKWDVVTRKPSGEGDISSLLKLLIIDEVHLLNEERGAVIETIVARTLRQVESSQSVIRIVGLSATLPNYKDVAEFLSVSPQAGLFYFDSSFRPVPLEQHYIGVRGKPGSAVSRKNIERVAYEKVAELVKQGHQVMVFVHARKETVKTALSLKEAALAEGTLDEFSCEEHPQWSLFRRSIAESRNKEMKQLFDNGFGIHHAGMLRSDRNMMERMFEARAIKVLCCTATLAWGVNLPAHAVIIKGTQVYDSTKGSFVDLSVLDVLQVFGRAGRPGLETSGEGYICTTEDKLQHYLDAVNSQVDIVCRFTAGMIDSLNAEISLGTVSNTNEAVRWLGYTYLFVRMRKNPTHYGISRETLVDDPQLGHKRSELATLAAKKLADARMIVFDQSTGALAATDLGRIAARYYIRHSSVEIFNKELKPKMTEADVLAMLSMSTEFEQIQIRESEVKELELLMGIIPCAVRGGTDTSQGKVNILLQTYISKLPVDDFALISDAAYVAQNGGRIIRALLEMAMSRKLANATTVIIGLTKAVEKRLWPFDEPLRQMSLKAEIFYGLENAREEYSVAELASMSAGELGELVRLNERHGEALLVAAKQFPAALMEYNLRPLGFDVLNIIFSITPTFNWSSKVHGHEEPFWLWLEDHNGSNIIQVARLAFHQTTEVLRASFVISIPNGDPPPSITVRFMSERWMGSEDELIIPMDALVMPSLSHSYTPLLDLPLLPRSVLDNLPVEPGCPTDLQCFNAIQTQVFWSLLQTEMNGLIAAPVGCGKSIMAHLVIQSTLLKATSKSCVLLITPRKSLAMESLSALRSITKATPIEIVYVTDQDILAPTKGRVVRVVTAENLLSALRHRDARTPFQSPVLVVCENLEQLNPSYELGVSLLRYLLQPSPTRFIGVSSSLYDPTDLAAWFEVDPLAMHSFRARDRDSPLIVSTQTFTIPYSAVLFKSMAKPAYAAIRSCLPSGPVIVFVPSRSQCRSAAMDFITQCALDMESERGFLTDDVSTEDLESYLAILQDSSLVDYVSRGIGLFHEGITKADRALILNLYTRGIVRALIVARESCWHLPVRAAAVVVMGTQHVFSESGSSERQLRDYDFTDLVRMQSRAVRPTGSGHFFLFCPTESRDTFSRFLDDGLPLESRLLGSDELQDYYKEKRRSGAIRSRQDGVDLLSFTFLARRLASNPLYYDARGNSLDESLSRVVDDLE
ncbi:hypothetical protein SERLA73DRAFT_120470 [Serpula lacrymans var. lacrymans S7.3]|uniref:Sec63-domain-containing protein n=2 Tax=Serpula lacrymans var. lacrymans TaxID=341189 RepID=F8PNU4_SERL3|nr:uncharacterized protein SERLADRAFT_367005 [Serpula lacrymans var. lacrymans S7.9]EGO01821.1 hypothetical protein SERLA73DRAFT_120470 [Serpula lacrymans var. lacrymans S7.3]EGO27451.1 hypothetical protein SERLADRAFT_367005 [Serpula lacrymans var. lacrymans S7.9]